MPSVLPFMDHWWTDHRRWMEPKLEEKPSFYFNRQFWATFEEDRAGVVLSQALWRRQRKRERQPCCKLPVRRCTADASSEP